MNNAKPFQRRLLCLISVFVAFALTQPLMAQQTAFQFDAAQTQVKYTLGDPLHTVHGTFALKSGIIRFDPATGKAGGEVVVDATSGASSSKSRDRRMHKNILESQKYPDITFTPLQVKGALPAHGFFQLEVVGTMNLHGSDHPLTVAIQGERNGEQISANARFIIPYVQWGLKNPSTFILRVSDKVIIDIEASGQLKTE